MTYAKDVNPERDKEELSLVHTFISEEHGMIYGICRGHQLIAAALGFKLFQDIQEEHPTHAAHKREANGATDASHSSAWHEIELTDTSNALYEATRKHTFTVNSRHHEAVIPAENPYARVIALEEGLVEAIEFKNGLGITVQFHPEDMGTEEADQILRLMVDRARNPHRVR